MPKKYLHCGQDSYRYETLTGSTGYGTLDMDVPTVGIKTYTNLRRINIGLESGVADHLNNVSQFDSVGGVFSDFHIFAAPNLNTRFNHLVPTNLVALSKSGVSGSIVDSYWASQEDIKAFPINKINKDLSGMGDPAFSYSLNIVDSTSLKSGDTITNAVAAAQTSFKLPWNTIMTQSSDGGFKIVPTTDIRNQKRGIYDPKYYIHFQNSTKMDKVLINRVSSRNDKGDTFINLKNSANKPLGPGGALRPGTIVKDNVPNTTIVVADVPGNDNFGTLESQANFSIPPGGPGCFPAGTQVMQSNGTINIEDILPRMKVVSFDASGLFVENEVKVLMIHKSGNPTLEITTTDDKVIQSTFYHKFFNPSLGIYRPIHQFNIGDPLRIKNGTVFIKEIKKLDKSFEVEYNLELVDEPRSYLVNGIVVHNAKQPPPLFPIDIVQPSDANPEF